MWHKKSTQIRISGNNKHAKRAGNWWSNTVVDNLVNLRHYYDHSCIWFCNFPTIVLSKLKFDLYHRDPLHSKARQHAIRVFSIAFSEKDQTELIKKIKLNLKLNKKNDLLHTYNQTELCT